MGESGEAGGHRSGWRGEGWLPAGPTKILSEPAEEGGQYPRTSKWRKWEFSRSMVGSSDTRQPAEAAHRSAAARAAPCTTPGCNSWRREEADGSVKLRNIHRVRDVGRVWRQGEG